MIKVIDIWWILNATVQTGLALFKVMHILAFAASTKPYRLPSAFLVSLVPESLKVCSSFLLVHQTIISNFAGEVKYNRHMTLLYILYSPVYKAVKIGISDVSGRRFASHRTKGWILIKYWWFSERDQARAVESLVVNTLTKKYGSFLDKADMPQGGYTETFDASKITRKGLIRMVNRAIKECS
jgi:hypothetical protein